MSRVPRREWYRRVNETWPDIVPELTGDEAQRAARRLYRFVRGRKWSGTVIQTSGRRHTWIRGDEMVVNASHGWKELVHLLSHAMDRGGVHRGEHARMERRMIKEVLRRGWLEGTLKRAPKPQPAPEDKRAKKIALAQAGIVRWERKLGRAQRALAKLRRKLRRLARDPDRSAIASAEGA